MSISPTVRLESMTQGRIEALESDKREFKEALESDKRELKAEVARLRTLVDELSPKNARLEEALHNATSNNIAATIFIGIGGFLVSYATFTGRSASAWAHVAAGVLLAGIGPMIWQSIRRGRSF